MIVICATLLKIPKDMTKLWSDTNRFTDFYSQSLSADLIFDLTIWFFFTTHCFDMMIICAKLFSNPTMYDKVMDRT